MRFAVFIYVVDLEIDVSTAFGFSIVCLFVETPIDKILDSF